jgi:glycerate kinase
MRNYTVLLASDSFKGSAMSREVEDYLEEGIRRVVPQAHILKYLIADGGEGTLEALLTACKGTRYTEKVHGPLGDSVQAPYALLGDRKTAVIEMAQASGITLMPKSNENALKASTYGTGELIEAALEQGARKFLIGLGGSATSDGGWGMAQALGVKFLDAEGQPIRPGLRGLRDLCQIDTSGLDPRIRESEFTALSDVTNPLTGSEGAVFVYGPQKGIAPEELHEVDVWMASYARLIEQELTGVSTDVPGAGAAGGLGAGLHVFCGARIVSGIDTILDLIGIESKMDTVDLVITGEGHMDNQSVKGKAPIGVAKRAKKHNLPVIAVVGGREDDLSSVYSAGIDCVLTTVEGPCTLEDCMKRVAIEIPNAGETTMRAFLLGRSRAQ